MPDRAIGARMERQQGENVQLKLSEDLIEEINRYVLTAVTIETACSACGIAPITYRKWIKRGRDEMDRVASTPKTRVRESERLFVLFWEMTDRSLKIVETRLANAIYERAIGVESRRVVETEELKSIVRNGQTFDELVVTDRKITTETSNDWQAAAWLLSRRNPTDFGQKQAVEVSGTGGGVIGITIVAPAGSEGEGE